MTMGSVLVACFAVRISASRGDDDIDFETNQLGRESRQPFWRALGIPCFDDDVLALDVA
jgi:hypothetical protein